MYSDGLSGRPFQIRRGVKKGDPLSGELLNFLLTGLHQHVSADRHAEIIIDGKKLFFIMYADNIVVLSKISVHARRTIGLVVQYLTFSGLKLDAAKCEAMVIVRRGGWRSGGGVRLDCPEAEPADLSTLKLRPQGLPSVRLAPSSRLDSV